MKLTVKKIQRLFDVIENTTIKFIALNLGIKTLTKKDLNILKKNGVDLNKLKSTDSVGNAYKFGIISESLGDKRTKDMTFNQFQHFIEGNEYLPLSEIDKDAIEFLRQRSYSDIKGLGNTYNQKLNKFLINTSKVKRKHIEKLIQQTSIQAIEKKQTIRELAQELRNLTKDWGRDFERIADYLMHEAYTQGKISSMLKRGNADDLEVYFSVKNGACKECQRLFLTNGIGSKPKIFKLSEIIKNENNIGRKQSEWKACTPVHPWCRCELIEKKPLRAWNTKTQMFSRPIQRNVLRERGAKVKVTIKTTS